MSRWTTPAGTQWKPDNRDWVGNDDHVDPYVEHMNSQPIDHRDGWDEGNDDSANIAYEQKLEAMDPANHPMEDAEARVAFVLAGVTGPAVFTLVSKKTGSRFTYRVRKGGEDKPWWVQVLTGPDNTSDYTYAGFLPEDEPTKLITGKKGMDYKAPCVVALRWFLKNPGHPSVEFYHEGMCGRCGRPLTVPQSVERGYGPTCWSML